VILDTREAAGVGGGRTDNFARSPPTYSIRFRSSGKLWSRLFVPPTPSLSSATAFQEKISMAGFSFRKACASEKTSYPSSSTSLRIRPANEQRTSWTHSAVFRNQFFEGRFCHLVGADDRSNRPPRIADLALSGRSGPISQESLDRSLHLVPSWEHRALRAGPYVNIPTGQIGV
jgi:hypothetical protein